MRRQVASAARFAAALALRRTFCAPRREQLKLLETPQQFWSE